MQTIYFEISITSASAGFGMYQLGESNYSPESAYASHSDLESEFCGDWKPIAEALKDADFVGAGIENIAGKIYGGDPGFLYASLRDEEITYFGVNTAKVKNDYFSQSQP